MEGTHVDQVLAGSCTNGRFENIRIAADTMGDEHVAKVVRLLVIPASRTEYMKVLRAGLVEQFMEAGAIVESPCCVPCMGGSFGLLGDSEVGLASGTGPWLLDKHSRTVLRRGGRVITSSYSTVFRIVPENYKKSRNKQEKTVQAVDLLAKSRVEPCRMYLNCNSSQAIVQ